MSRRSLLCTLSLAAVACAQTGASDESGDPGPGALAGPSGTEPLRGWLEWRGPEQTGASTGGALPDELGEPLWTLDLAGRGTPVLAGERLYAMGYGMVDDYLLERVVCLDARTGELIWEDRWPDYLSDSIYDRYAIGSPSIHPETGKVIVLTTGGLMRCYDADGALLWERALTESYGRLSFPNGRTGSAVIEGDLAITHFIYTCWGPQGPARDRMHAFDVHTGELVWTATPGGPPKDSSFSRPFLTWRGGRRVLYVGLGGGHLSCVDARTGDTLWQHQLSIGGLNCSPIATPDRLFAIHGKENLDTSVIGRMVAVDLSGVPEPAQDGVARLDSSHEAWRNDLVAFTSSPVLADGRLYVTVATGELCCVDPDDGAILWSERLGSDQIHASPAFGDGKLYVPMNDGSLHVVRPADEGPKVLSRVQLGGNCLAAPALGAGRVYVHTTEALYCFGEVGEWGPAPLRTRPAVEVGPAARLQVVPADVVLAPGETVRFRVRALDANGHPVEEDLEGGAWSLPPVLEEAASGGPPGTFSAAAPGVGVAGFLASPSGLAGSARVRVVPTYGYEEGFESGALRPSPADADALVGNPPPFWIGAMKKWEVRELEGERVLAKTLENPLFQRANSFFGHPDMSNYTVQVDIRAEGGRRTIASGGVFNQRYLIELKGSHQELEVSSNVWQLKESVPFKWKAGEWIRVKSRVDVAGDGSGVVRAKAWRRDDAEPDAWTLEVPVSVAHVKGAPGVFGLGPQSRYRVYLDNITVTKND